MFEGDDRIRIPQPITALCSEKMLTMEYMDGKPLKHFARDEANDPRCDMIARQGAE